MYNLSFDEISMVDGGGDGAYSGSNNTGRHTTYGGQGNGFQASGQHGGSLSMSCLGSTLAGAIGGALTGGPVGAVVGANMGAYAGGCYSGGN